MRSKACEGQLEFFEVTSHQAPRPHPSAVGRMAVELRYDQVVIGGIFVLIGLAVVFAVGVERGKQLARAEQALIVSQQPVMGRDAQPSAQPQEPQASESPTPSAAEEMTPHGKSPLLPPSATPKVKEPGRPVTVRSRYAVQIVTYSRIQLAQAELKRLLAQGVPAFLVTRDGRTKVYVGPFPSRASATERLAALRSRYHDCFVKTL